jgi:hypothetical protein
VFKQRPITAARRVVVKKFEFCYETLVTWKVDAQGAANFFDPDRGRIPAFVGCLACKYYMILNLKKMGLFDNKTT